MRSITPDERKFALCFARTLSVKHSCAAAGFEGRTSFARASRLLERDDVGTLIRAEILRGNAATAPCGDPKATDSGNVPVSLEIVRETNDNPEPASCVTECGQAATDSTDTVCPSAPVPDGEPPRNCGIASCDCGAASAHADGRDEASYDCIEERILREYERIAFADTASGDVKIADKLRALEQYRAIAERRLSKDSTALSLTVNYDYGDGCG